MIKFVIYDYNDLLNMHKALMEAKFHENPDNNCIAGSPIIARIMNQIVEILSENDPYNGSWEIWRNIKSHRTDECGGNSEWSKMIKSAARNENWSKYSYEKKLEVASIYLSPFTYDSQDLIDFVDNVDEFN